MSLRHRIACVFACLLTLQTAKADISTATTWLQQQQQTNGSVSTAQDVTQAYRSSFEASQSISGLNATNLQSYYDGLNFSGTEFLARKSIISEASNKPTIIELIAQRRHANGGFSSQKDYDSTPYDTYWALRAISQDNVQSEYVLPAVEYLSNQQNTDGGWSNPESFSSVPLTARITILMAELRRSYPAIQPIIDRGTGFLLANASLSDSISNKALVVTALSKASTAKAVSTSFLQNINAGQQANGSWEDRAYTTALVIQATLALEQSSAISDIDGSIGTIKGKVVNSGSSEPLTAVTIQLVSNNSKNIQSDQAGNYTLSKLPLGQHTVQYSKAGYLTRNVAVTISDAVIQTIDDVALTAVDSSALFTGKITDDQSGAPIAGAMIKLNGNAYTVNSLGDGSFSLAGIPGGQYSILVSADGYRDVNGQIGLDNGTNNIYNQGMISNGTVLNDAAIAVTGRVIDGDTGQVIGAAQLTLSNGSTASSDANGAFNLETTARGNYSLDVTASGYRAVNIDFTLPAGASGSLGDIKLYRTQVVIPSPTTLDIAATVIDAITKQPIANVGLSVQGANISATTDSNGQASLNGLSTTDFVVEASVSGYLTQQLSFNAGGFGQAAIAIELTPEPTGNQNTVSLSGTVSNAAGTAISGAVIKVAGTTIEATSDASGQYSLTGISQLEFSVSVSAANYLSQTFSYRLQQAGSYTADIQLADANSATGFNIINVNGPSLAVEGYGTATTTTQIQNLGASPQQVIVRGQIFTLDDRFIANVSPNAGVSDPAQSIVTFQGNETKDLSLHWNTLQTPPGTYKINVDVITLGSITQQSPDGNVLQRASSVMEITATARIEGGLQFDPPIARVGTSIPTQLEVVVRNIGNVELSSGNYRLQITDEQGAVVTDVVRAVSTQAINQLRVLDFGGWIPSTEGHHQISIQSVDNSNLSVTGTYFVGSIATARYTLSKRVFPEGDSTATGRLAIKGITNSDAAVNDALFARTRTATINANQFEQTQVDAWDTTNVCIGCHVQTQAVFGMSAVSDFIAVDQTLLNRLSKKIADRARTPPVVPGIVIAEDDRALEVTKAWALSETSAISGAIPKLDDLADFHDYYKTESNGDIHWEIGDAVGWMNSSEAATYIVAKSINALQKSIDRGDAVDATRLVQDDDTPGVSITAQGSMNVVNTSLSSDGTAMYVSGYSHTNKVDLSSGAVETIGGSQSFSSRGYWDAVDFNGDLYIIGENRLIVKRASGRTDLYTIDNGYIDLQVWNGQLYALRTSLLTTRDDARLYLWDKQAKQFNEVSGSRTLKFPRGMSLSHDNRLLIADNEPLRIMTVNANDELVEYKGIEILGSPRIRRVFTFEDGRLFVEIDNQSQFGPVAGIIIYPSGIVDNYQIQTQNPYAVIARATDGKDIYGIQQNLIKKMKFVDVVTPEDVTRNTNLLQGVANWLDDSSSLAQPTELHTLAMRLLGLNEAKDAVTDVAQQTQVQTTLDALDVQIRALQNADGGWSRRVGEASDPVTTALMGLALDVKSPSKDDPVVRNAITYLLNSQQSNGSWTSTFFGNSLGSVGAIMSYLPRALSTFGGIDLTAKLTMPANISLASPSVAPTSTTITNGDTEYSWDLTDVSATDGQTISFDVTFNNLLLDEIRPAAKSANLTYQNSFNNEQIVVPVAIPEVTATASIGLLANTNKATYSANEQVDISSVLRNLGPQFTNGNLTVQLEGAQGVVIETLAPITTVNLAQSESQTYTHQWNTGSNSAGTYAVIATVRSSNGSIQSQQRKPFTIELAAENGDIYTQYSTSVSTDRAKYQAFDQVQLSSRVRNLTLNQTNDPVLLKVSVRGGRFGLEIFSKSYSVNALQAQGLQDFNEVITLNDAQSGFYNIQLELFDAEGNQRLSDSSGQFQVDFNPLSKVDGGITASANSLAPGEPQNCTATLRNLGQSEIGLLVNILLVSIDPDQEIQNIESFANFEGSNNWAESHSFDTSNLAEGNYACILIARSFSEDTRTVGVAGFVIEEQIKVDYEITIDQQGKGRWLVLHDPVRECVEPEETEEEFCPWHDEFHGYHNHRGHNSHYSSDEDEEDSSRHSGRGNGHDHHRGHGWGHWWYHGPTPEEEYQECLTEAVQQQKEIDTLKATFDAEGLSYTLMSKAKDFKQALYNGQYGAYALFNESVQLDTETQLVLSEAVYQGDSLMVAGALHEHCSDLEPALGLYFDGYHDEASKVEIPANLINQSGELLQLSAAQSIDVHEDTAQIVAHFLAPEPSNDNHWWSWSWAGHYGSGNHRRNHYVDWHGHSHNHYEDHYFHCPEEEEDPAPAVLKNSYGMGQSLTIAFDALEEASKVEEGVNHYVELLRYGLRTVQAAQAEMRLGKAVPLNIHTQNKGVAVTARLRIQPPAGISIAEAQGWQQVTLDDGNGGSITEWQLEQNLAEEQLLSQTIYIVASSNASITVNSDYRLTDEPWTDLLSVSLDLQPSGIPTSLAEAITVLEQAIETREEPYLLKHALRKLKKAEKRWSKGKERKAMLWVQLAIETLEYSPTEEDKALRKTLGNVLLQLASQRDLSKMPSHGHGYGHHGGWNWGWW